VYQQHRRPLPHLGIGNPLARDGAEPARQAPLHELYGVTLLQSTPR
jgi:hypothetical protein